METEDPYYVTGKNAKLDTYDVSNLLKQNYVWYLPITTLLTNGQPVTATTAATISINRRC